MDDIDEGIGSNESNISSMDTASLIDSLKYLNGIQTDSYGKVEHLSIHDNFTSSITDDRDLSNDSKNFNTCTNGEKYSENVETHSSVLNGHINLPEEKSVAEELVDFADNKDEIVTTVLSANPDSCHKSPLANSIADVDNTQDCQKDFAFTGNETQSHEDTLHLTSENLVSCNSRESEKSPFVLDDKIRNSLKGLVAKMKCFPDRKSDSKNITDSDADKISDTDRPEIIAIQKDTSIEKLQKREMQELHEERDNNDNKSSLDTTAGPNQVDTAKSHCTSQDIKDNDTTASEKLMSRNTSILNLNADMLDNFDDNDKSIPMEIGSDNEDMLLQMSPGNHKIIDFTRKLSIDAVQFDEDSSSQTSDNSGKINDIVKFLSDDLPNSPLEISSSRNTNKPNPLDLNLNKSESRYEDLPNKELDSKSDAKSSIELLKDAENNAVSPISKLSIKCKVDVTVNKISDEEIVNPKEKNEISFKTEMTEKHGHSDNILQEMLEPKIFPNTDRDDDIIFEVETKLAANSKLQMKVIQEALSSNKNGNSQIVSANINCINVVENKMELTVNDLTCKDHINVSVNDDDVIFEKEVKANDISKQNCDISRINTNADKICVKDQDLLLCSENKYNSLSDSKSTKVEQLGMAQTNKKRPAEEKEISNVIAKRSKLQGLIGKLEARVEPSKLEASDEPASIELSDSDGDDSATTDTAHERDSLCSEEDILVKNQEVKPKTITLTELELEALVREKVKAYLTSQRDSIIARLSQKVKELQTNNDLWKRQVKDLQVKVNDVTVLQKKLEKRKAATAALRQITTRHVAIQVEDGRARKAKTAITPTKSSPANGPVLPNGDTRTIRLPIAQSTINQSILTPQSSQPAQLVTNAYMTPSVKSLLDTTRIQRTLGSVTSVTTSATTSIVNLLQYPSGYVTQTSIPQGYLTMPGAVVTPVTANVSKIVPKVVQAASAANTITLTSSNSKVIDLTDDDENQKTRRVTLPTGFTMNAPGVRHVVAAPPGTQLVRMGTSAQPTYQLVFNPASPVLRPVNVVASTAGQTGTLLSTISPKNVVNLTSTAGINSGSTLAHVVVTAAPTVVQPKMALTHPAPFPSIPKDQALDGLKAIPPKPSLKISRVSQGIVLSWNMVMTDNVAEISIYQLFAYQQTSAPPSSALWKKVGDVKALPLPMACTLTQFQVGNKYHFAVRAMDVHQRVGQFSDPGSIHLTPGPPVM